MQTPLKIKLNLLKISFAISLLGILLLLFLSNTLKPKQINIGDINDKLLNKKIQIQGEISNIKNFINFQLISIQDDTGEIDIILNKNLNLKKNQNIIVTGTVKQYKDSLQIQADKIILGSS